VISAPDNECGLGLFRTFAGRAEHAVERFDPFKATYIAITQAGQRTAGRVAAQSEVAAMGVPAIFVPLANAIDDHQTANARFLTDVGAGLLLKQSDLNSISLADTITAALKHLTAMSCAAQGCARLDATEVVAGYCIAEAGL
jgi:UDP-N-acetylglucosamine:LPS N-acetylglucosamine transferase